MSKKVKYMITFTSENDDPMEDSADQWITAAFKHIRDNYAALIKGDAKMLVITPPFSEIAIEKIKEDQDV